ncbi:hypothetical protein [Hahella ganghwensis]|uniref:hypothetical protein n=1 Tax=Hahella ganghwensis TaxID=286420 RepID=UPI000380E152|nr:hypothetical protein [Hahella ganghwensis]
MGGIQDAMTKPVEGQMNTGTVNHGQGMAVVTQGDTGRPRAALNGGAEGEHNQMPRRLSLISVDSALSETEKFDRHFSTDLNGTDQVMGYNERELGSYLEGVKKRAAETLGVDENHPFILGIGRTNSTYARNAMQEWGVSPISKGSSSYYRDAPNKELAERRESLGIDGVKTNITGGWAFGDGEVGSVHEQHGKLYYACALNSKPSNEKIQLIMGDFLAEHNLSHQVITHHVNGKEVHSIAIFSEGDKEVGNNKWQEAGTQVFNLKMPDALRHLVSMAGLPIDVDRLERVTFESTDSGVTTGRALSTSKDLSKEVERTNFSLSGAIHSMHQTRPPYTGAGSAENQYIQKQMIRDLLTALPNVDEAHLKTSCSDMGIDPENALKFIDKTLERIDRLVDKLEKATDDSKANTLINHLFMEIENYLALTQPYETKDFTEAFISNRQGYIDHHVDENFVQDAYLVSSGMDSIETALEAAASAEAYKDPVEKTLLGHRNIYFEARELTNHGGKSDTSPVINACLNSSTPGNTIQQSDIKSLVEKRIGELKDNGTPVSLVLDISLETTEHEVNDMLNQLHEHVKSGDLQILLCKSYQKYPSLGSGKLLAGGITLINNGDQKFSQTKNRLEAHQEQCNMIANRHGQLTAHFTKAGRNAELAFIQRAAENARFLRDRVLGNEILEHSEGLPFLNIPSKDSAAMQAVTKGYMNSFAGLGTSILGIADYKGNFCHRVNTGIESQAQLIENYYYSGARGKADTHLKTMNAYRNGLSGDLREKLLNMRPGELGQDDHPRKIAEGDWLEFIHDHAANMEASLLLGKMNEYVEFKSNSNPIYSGVRIKGMLNTFRQGVDLLNHQSASQITDFNKNKMASQVMSGLLSVLTIDKATLEQKSEAVELMIEVASHCRNSVKANMLYHLDAATIENIQALPEGNAKLETLVEAFSSGLNESVKAEIKHHHGDTSIMGQLIA